MGRNSGIVLSRALCHFTAKGFLVQNPLGGFSVWTLHVLFVPGTLVSSHCPNRLVSDSKSAIGVNGYLSMYVSAFYFLIAGTGPSCQPS